ncbi:MAG: hypothetical protein CVU11_03985 [Bacteroidetes bacterium HGW-Bacteroidetes-6]|jgi:hypothetical protein|nr:MAG: hypothetical protein CVU11_03985 [Bacteroidetes bacterium HGW-Bacteroidetes-6]
MKKIILFQAVLFITFQLSFTAEGQNKQPQRSIELKEKPLAFSVDAFGNLFVLQQNGSLVKYDTTGNIISLPGRKTSSSLWAIDAQNPYKIILFNRDLQQADMFNASFSKINSYNLNNIDAGDIALFCGSHNSGFWAFTSQGRDLIRFDDQWGIVSQTNILTLLEQDDFVPDILIESDRKVLLAQREGTALIFDIFGNMLLRFPENANNYVLGNDILYFLKNDSIFAYQTVLHEETNIQFGIKNISNFAFSSPWFAIMSDNKIFLFLKS